MEARTLVFSKHTLHLPLPTHRHVCRRSSGWGTSSRQGALALPCLLPSPVSRPANTVEDRGDCGRPGGNTPSGQSPKRSRYHPVENILTGHRLGNQLGHWLPGRKKWTAPAGWSTAWANNRKCSWRIMRRDAHGSIISNCRISQKKSWTQTKQPQIGDG